MFLLILDHPGCPGQNPESHKMVVCVRGILYNSCVQSSMLHGSETRPIRKENEVVLQWAEMRMVRSMCGIKLQKRVQVKR